MTVSRSPDQPFTACNTYWILTRNFTAPFWTSCVCVTETDRQTVRQDRDRPTIKERNTVLGVYTVLGVCVCVYVTDRQDCDGSTIKERNTMLGVCMCERDRDRQTNKTVMDQQ